jgi:CRP/FNR family transcriptional regulator
MIRQYPREQRIFEQDEPTTGLWFVIDGRVAVERVGADGTLTTIGVWIAGDIVGIAGLWDGSGYPASARALTSPTILGWIEREAVLDLHQKVPAFGLEVSRMLAERLRLVQESVADRLGRPMVSQVASMLATLSQRMGATIPLTHEDLAHMIGTHRETVSRALQVLARYGAVALQHGTIVILNRSKLDECAEGIELSRHDR